MFTDVKEKNVNSRSCAKRAGKRIILLETIAKTIKILYLYVLPKPTNLAELAIII